MAQDVNKLLEVLSKMSPEDLKALLAVSEAPKRRGRKPKAAPAEPWYMTYFNERVLERAPAPESARYPVISEPFTTPNDEEAEMLLQTITIGQAKLFRTNYWHKIGYRIRDHGVTFRTAVRAKGPDSAPFATVLDRVPKGKYSQWDWVRGDLSVMLQDLRSL